MKGNSSSTAVAKRLINLSSDTSLIASALTGDTNPTAVAKNLVNLIINVPNGGLAMSSATLLDPSLTLS